MSIFASSPMHVSPLRDPTVAAPTGGRALAVAQALRVLLRFGSAAVLARLLLPSEYGVFGMAAVIYGIVYLVRDLGANAGVHQPALTPADFGGLCRLGLLGGIAAGLLCTLAAPAAAAFYREPLAGWVLFALAASLPFSGAAAPRLSLLYRLQRAPTAAGIDVAAAAGSAVVGLLCAWKGAGVWSLVALTTTHEAIACALAIAACPWRQAALAPVPWRRLLGQGADTVGAQLSAYVSRTVDQVVVGRFAGADALGLYGRAAQLTTLPAQFTVHPYTTWIVAELGRQLGHPERYAAQFRRVLNGVAHLTLPVAALCVTVPDLLLRGLFGPQWTEAAPVARLLGVTLALQPWLFAPTWILLSHGRTRRLAHVTLAASVGVVLAVLAVRHGAPSAIAAAAVLATTVSAIAVLPWVVADTPLRARDLIVPALRPLTLAAGLGGMLAWARHAMEPAPGPAFLFVAGGGLAALYGIALGLWPQVRQELTQHFLIRR